jgi:hypothetical protein
LDLTRTSSFSSLNIFLKLDLIFSKNMTFKKSSYIVLIFLTNYLIPSLLTPIYTFEVKAFLLYLVSVKNLNQDLFFISSISTSFMIFYVHLGFLYIGLDISPFSLFAVLEIETKVFRALLMLGKHSTIELHSQPLG